MNYTNYTKGEWYADIFVSHADVRSREVDGSVIRDYHIAFSKVCDANLIAAAPEMYEALKDIAEMKVMPVSYIELAKSIVAKVEGGG